MDHNRYRTLSDIELCEQLSAGDDLAFRELYERYWETLINAAHKRLESIEKAEDLVQNLFVNLYKNRKTLQIHCSPEAYFKISLKRLVLNQFRSDGYERKYADHLLSIPASPEWLDNPQHRLQAKELAQRIDLALLAVPPKARQVFRLAKIENRSHREISEILGISLSTIEKHIAKATNILRRELQSEIKGDRLYSLLFLFPFFFK